jgi:hypothetical protein
MVAVAPTASRTALRFKVFGLFCISILTPVAIGPEDADLAFVTPKVRGNAAAGVKGR